MIDNTARYKYFRDNEAKVWKSRFAWHGEHGDGSYPNINVVSFFKEHDIDFNAAFNAECWRALEHLLETTSSDALESSSSVSC